MLILYWSLPKAQHFHLQKDPKEEKNIADEQPHIVNEYEKNLKNCLRHKDDKHEGLNELETKSIEDDLKKLGYI